MDELDNWWKIIKDWGITGNMLGQYFTTLAEKDSAYYGYSSGEISGITTGKKPAKVESFKGLLKQTFSYDFENPGPKSYDCSRLIDHIKKTYGSKTRKIFFEVDHNMAQCFQGLYLGIVRVLSETTSEPIDTPYLFYIKETGDVELKAAGAYFRMGFITSFNYKVYFMLDSKNRSEPELYITSIPQGYQSESFKVERFKMCGTWLNRAKKPAYGSTVLVKQLSPESVITSMPDSGDSLETVSKQYFKDLINDSKYKVLVEELKPIDFGVHYINSEEAIQVEEV